MFYQLSGHPLAQSSGHMKLTITPAQGCLGKRPQSGLYLVALTLEAILLALRLKLSPLGRGKKIE